MSDLKEIKDKIAKLLAKAEGTDNPYEAGAFMQKVNELLEQYQMEIHEIRLHAGKVDDPMGHQDGEFNVYASMMWAKTVLHMVAKYYGARIVWSGKRKNHMPYKIFGVESARVTAELMIPYIVSQVRQQARVYADDYRRTQSVAQREVGLALATRIAEILTVAQERRATLEKNALVPVNDVQAYLDNYYGSSLRANRGSKKGYGAGARDYADKISLNRQATGAGHLKIGGVK